MRKNKSIRNRIFGERKKKQNYNKNEKSNAGKRGKITLSCRIKKKRRDRRIEKWKNELMKKNEFRRRQNCNDRCIASTRRQMSVEGFYQKNRVVKFPQVYGSVFR